MSDYVITCESTVDLSDEVLKEREIPYACFTFTADGKTYKDDYGKSYPIDKFYADITKGMQPITSQINVETYQELFEPILKSGKDVLHITLSSGISGTINSAKGAADILNDKYPNKVHVIDSLCASGGYGMCVILAKDNLDKGMSLEDNLKWVEENKLNVIHWFYSTDLTSFIRGGRVSKTAGAIAGVLQLCPVMCVSKRGTLEVVEKVRTKKKAAKAVVDKMLAEVGADYDGYVYLTQSACKDDAQTVVDLVKANFPKAKEPQVYNIGTVIGSHTGPGTVALFFVGKNRAVD